VAGLEMREDQRDRLRMLAAQRRRELLRVRLAQAVEPRRVGELRRDAAEDRFGALATVRLLENLGRLLEAAGRQRGGA
jgi:hypothetical protein